MRIIEKNIIKTKVMDLNAAYYGVSIYEWMGRAGRGIAKILNTKYNIQNTGRKIAIFCGLGNNGGDGFAAAKYLHDSPNPTQPPLKLRGGEEGLSRRGEEKGGYEVMVYLFGREEDIKTEEARRTWQEMKEMGVPFEIITDVKSLRGQSPKQSPWDRRGANAPRDDSAGIDVIVDCLLGTGVKGELREPIATAVKQLNNLTSKHKAKSVVVDVPTPGIKKIDLAISMQFPKVEGAEAVDLQSDSGFLSKIGIGEFKALEFPGPDSHKGDVGYVLIVSGFGEYHGALLYAVKTASKIVDIVYVYTSEGNRERIERLKDETAEFIAVRDANDANRANAANKYKYECVLVGPGMGRSERTVELTKQVLKSKQKAVLDADALVPEIVDFLHEQVILTPHKAEFERIFQTRPTDKNLLKMAEKHNCTIVLKGQVDIVADPDWGIKYNYTGNVGMTKGGTGDVLAALIASFYCLTDDPYLAAASGVFVNGLAGDELYQKVNRFYDSEDLIKQLPKTLKYLIQS